MRDDLAIDTSLSFVVKKIKIISRSVVRDSYSFFYFLNSSIRIWKGGIQSSFCPPAPSVFCTPLHQNTTQSLHECIHAALQRDSWYNVAWCFDADM